MQFNFKDYFEIHTERVSAVLDLFKKGFFKFRTGTYQNYFTT